MVWNLMFSSRKVKKTLKWESESRNQAENIPVEHKANENCIQPSTFSAEEAALPDSTQRSAQRASAENRQQGSKRWDQSHPFAGNLRKEQPGDSQAADLHCPTGMCWAQI